MEPKPRSSKIENDSDSMEEFELLGSDDSLLQETPSLKKIYEERGEKLKSFRPLIPTKFKEQQLKSPDPDRTPEGKIKMELEEIKKRKPIETPPGEPEETLKRESTKNPHRESEETPKRKLEETPKRKLEETSRRKSKQIPPDKLKETRKREQTHERKSEETSPRKSSERRPGKLEEMSRRKATETPPRNSTEKPPKTPEERPKRKPEQTRKPENTISSEKLRETQNGKTNDIAYREATIRPGEELPEIEAPELHIIVNSPGDDTLTNERRRAYEAGEAAAEKISSSKPSLEDTPSIKQTRASWKGVKFGVFYTSEMYKHKDKETYTFLAIKEFIIYLIFLTSVSIVSIGSLSISMYYYSFVLSDVFTRTNFKTENGLVQNYREIKTIQQYWAFLQQTLIDTMFFQYFEDKLTNMTITMQEAKLVLLENILIGSPRLRQLRVKPNSCKVPKNFEGLFRSCYGYYKGTTEDKKPFGLKTGSEWTYSDNLARPYSGKISTYGTGGYYLNLTRNYARVKSLIQNLHDNLWINHGTRAVFVDFTLYSPNVNLFCIVKLVAEFPPSGGVITSSNFNTLKLIRYVSAWDFVILAFEIVVLVVLVLYTIEEIREMIILEWDYLKNAWNILDITIIITGWNLFTIALIRSTWITWELPTQISTIDTDDHGNFDSISNIQKIFNTASAFFLAFVWIKLLKFMMLIKVTYHIFKTIKKCLYEIFGLTCIFIVLIMSFALLGHLLFGSQVEEFGTVGQSIISLLVMIIGALDHKKVQEIRPFLGPLYIMFYIYVVVILFMCLFVAVIINAFSSVRFDIMEDSGKLYVKELFDTFLQNFLKYTQLKTLGSMFAKKVRKGVADTRYQVILEILRRSGFRGPELSLFLSKHHIEKGETITSEKMQEIYDEIDGKEMLYREAIEHEEIANDVDLLKLKLAYSEKIIEELSTKVDLLIEKIEHKKEKIEHKKEKIEHKGEEN